MRAQHELHLQEGSRIEADDDLPQPNALERPTPYSLAMMRRVLFYSPWSQHLYQLPQACRQSHAVVGVSSAVVVSSPRRLALLKQARFFLQRARLIDWIWQPLLLATLLYDFIRYASFPTERYGNTELDLFLGQAQNPEAFSTHFGSDRVSDLNYWWAAGLLSGFAFLLGFKVLDRLQAACAVRRDPKQATLAFIREQGFEAQQAGQKDADVLNLVQAATGSSLLAYTARDRLAEVADSYLPQPDDGPPLGPAAPDKAWSALTQLTQRGARWQRLHTRYRLWALGAKIPKTPWYVSAPFVLWGLWQYYAQYRKWRLPIEQLIVHPVRRRFAKKECLADGKVFGYSAEREQDDYCSVCHDWDFVPYQLTDEAQSCLDYALKQAATPWQLTNDLQRFTHHGQASSIDLSHQAWGQWTETQWDDFITAIEQHIVDLQHLDLSWPARHSIYPIDNKIERLAQLALNHGPQTLSLRHRAYGPETLLPLLLSLANNATESVDLSSTDLLDEGLQALADVLLSGTAIRDLMLEENELTDAGLIRLSEALPATLITRLILSGNLFGTRGIEHLSQALTESQVTELRLNRVNLPYSASDCLWSQLPDSSLTRLHLQSAGLDDRSLMPLGPALANSTLLELDLSHNPLGDLALLSLFPYLTSSPLTSLYLAYTQVSLGSLNPLGPILAQTSLQSLDVTGCRLQTEGYDFLEGVWQSGLTDLSMGYTELGPNNIAYLTSLWVKYPNATLSSLALPGNGLSDEQGMALIEAMQWTPIDSIDFSRSELTGDWLTAVAEVIGHWDLRTLNASRNTIAWGLSALGEHIADSALETLDVSFNDLPGSEVQAFVPSLLTFMHHPERLSERAVSRPQKRDLHQQSAATKLRAIALAGNRVDTPAARAFCRTVSVAGIGFNLADNPMIDTDEVMPSTCQVSAATRPTVSGYLWALPVLLRFSGHIVKAASEGVKVISDFWSSPTSAEIVPSTTTINSPSTH